MKKFDSRTVKISNLESIFIEVNHPKKDFICASVFKHPNRLNTDFNTNYSTTLLEKLNRKSKICFTIGDFNINLTKLDSELDNSQFFVLIFSHYLFFKSHGLLKRSKTLIYNISSTVSNLVL